MSKQIALAVLLALLPATTRAQLQRAPIPPAWFEVNGGAVFESGDQDADTGWLAGVRAGINFTSVWAVEAEVFRDEQSFASGIDLEHTGGAVNLVKYNRTPLWNPYFLIGVGALRYELPDDSDADYMAHVAVGGQWDLTEGGVQLRAELRYRYSPVDSALAPGILEDTAPVFRLGIMIPLGGR
ncbi:MAG: outer membrane beta-barrel protein [Pseudomonadota bacterium]